MSALASRLRARWGLTDVDLVRAVLDIFWRVVAALLASLAARAQSRVQADVAPEPAKPPMLGLVLDGALHVGPTMANRLDQLISFTPPPAYLDGSLGGYEGLRVVRHHSERPFS